MIRTTTSSGSRRGLRSIKLAAALALLCLATLARPAAAIGGWDPIHNIMNRLSGQRAKSDEPKAGRKSPEERIAPVSNGGGNDKKEEGGAGGGGKKRHVGEVKMTSSSERKPPTSSSAAEEGNGGPAFVPRGRRGGLHLDENDLRTITFVGRSNPFL